MTHEEAAPARAATPAQLGAAGKRTSSVSIVTGAHGEKVHASQPTEEWRAVPGYEGIFETTATGSVRSARTRRRLKPHLHPSGYQTIATRVGGRKGRAVCGKVHRLVALAWSPARDGADVVNHRNGVKTDNRAANLEWATPSENTRHAYRTGLREQARGEASSAAKLTRADVLSLRRRFPLGHPILQARQVAAEYGIDHSTLYQAVRGQTWKHLPMPEVPA